jgi:hypothetical protein
VSAVTFKADGVKQCLPPDDEAERRFQEQIELANHIANLGGRYVWEAMRAVRRGQTIQSVLEEFQRLPRWRGLRVVGVSR